MSDASQRYFRSCGPQFSFFDFVEHLACGRPNDRPFHHVCEVMRKSSAETVFVQRHVENEDYYESEFKHLAKHLSDVSEMADVIEVSQVTFFSVRIDDAETRIPDRVRDDDVLATALLVSLRLRRDRGKFRTGQAVCFVYEAVLRFPTVMVPLAKTERSDNSNGPSKHRVGPKKVRADLLNNYYHVRDEFTVWIHDRRFSITGTYFIQSCGIEAVCAHACLKMAMLQQDPEEAEPISSRGINDIVTDYRRKKDGRSGTFDPLRGLTTAEIKEVSKANGVRTFVLDVAKEPDTPPYDFAYLLAENGFPVLLSFYPIYSRKRPADRDRLHVVAVVGHTRNSDEWFPFAQAFYPWFDAEVSVGNYVSAARWATHLLVHDDMLGPSLCLRARDLVPYHEEYPREENPPRADGEPARQEAETKEPILGGRVHSVIGLVPEAEGLEVSPYDAERTAATFFWKLWEPIAETIADPWRSRFLRDRFKPQNLVLRTLAITRDDYIDHLNGISDFLGHGVQPRRELREKLEAYLPGKLWMTEFSIPEVFSSNRTKFGEVLTDVKLPVGDAEEDYLAFRFVDQLILRNEVTLSLGLRSHCPVYRLNSGADGDVRRVEF